MISAGVEGDNTSVAITKALTEGSDRVFDNAKDFRARRIAITESARATHAADIMAASDSGIVQGFMPIISSDACERCQVYDENNQPTGKALFPYTSIDDAVSNMFEYDGRSMPPFHPNCACTVETVFIDEPTPDHPSGVPLEQIGKKEPDKPRRRPGGQKPKAEPIDKFLESVVEG